MDALERDVRRLDEQRLHDERLLERRLRPLRRLRMIELGRRAAWRGRNDGAYVVPSATPTWEL
jgi:hypothetical protein